MLTTINCTEWIIKCKCNSHIHDSMKYGMDFNCVPSCVVQ